MLMVMVDPEIFASDPSQDRILAFRFDGTGWWSSPTIPGRVVWGSASLLADLDHDGKSEIVIGSTVLNSDETFGGQAIKGVVTMGRALYPLCRRPRSGRYSGDHCRQNLAYRAMAPYMERTNWRWFWGGWKLRYRCFSRGCSRNVGQHLSA